MIFLYLLIILIINYLGYIQSMHHLASYILPEDLSRMTEHYSSLSKRYIREVITNPRISLQVTIAVKSFILIASSFLAVLASKNLFLIYGLNETAGLIICLVTAWVFYLFFAEYLPGRRAIGTVDQGALRFVPICAFLCIFVMPIIKLYNRIIYREAGKISEEHKEEIIERAIESLAVQAGVNEPLVEEDEKEMIGQILQLGATEVREVMVPRIDIIGLKRDCTLGDIRELTDKHGYSRYPIYGENLDEIVGVLYIKDLFTNIPLPIDEAAFEISKYMKPPYFIPESKKISDLLAEFKTNRVHIAIVIDEYGGTSGLVTMEDILEEIVGDIKDEHDYEAAEMVKMPDNSIMVDAGISMEELIDELGLDYDTGEFETVSGLIYDLVGSVPASGTRLKWKDIMLSVDKVEGQRIIAVKAWVEKKVHQGGSDS